MSDTDAELSAVYWLYRHHGWKPSDYWDLPEGERTLVFAMVSLESETGRR